MAGGYIGKCPIPTPIFFAIITVVIVYLILKKTALGLYIESVGINGKAARLVGLNSSMIKFLTYVICRVDTAGCHNTVNTSQYTTDNIGKEFNHREFNPTRRAAFPLIPTLSM